MSCKGKPCSTHQQNIFTQEPINLEGLTVHEAFQIGIQLCAESSHDMSFLNSFNPDKDKHLDAVNM